MKQKTTTHLLTNLFFIFLCMPFSIFGQIEKQPTEIISEDFSVPGIPFGWTTEDLSGNNVIWTWCEDPTAPNSATCPGVWVSDENNQKPFSSATADNGFLTLNSDFAGNNSTPHISQLTTSPIDFSTGNQAWVQFQTHLGAFNINPDGKALLRVSVNGGINWTNFNCFPGFKLTTRWTNNPEILLFDISAIAAGQSEVLLQWQWEGNFEYNWSIDDIKIFDEDPRPANDLIVTKKWFAIAPNAITPASQVSTFGFTADILNFGSQIQSNVKLAIEIFNQTTNTIDYRDTLEYGTLEVDELVQNVLFSDQGFTAAMAPGIYKGTYKVFSDSIDANFANNIQTFSFEISETTFAKETKIESSTLPGVLEWEGSDFHSWAWGNHFLIPNGGSHEATAATFAIANASFLTNYSVTLALYEWKDENNNGDTESNERTLVGFNNYLITSSTPDAGFVTIPLLNISGDIGVSLVDNGNYILMLEYNAIDSKDLFISHSEENDYGAAMFRAEQDGQPQYISMSAVQHPLDNATFYSAGFGTQKVPNIRLEVEAMNSVSNYVPLSPQNKVDLFPNPVDQKLFVDLELERSFEQMDLNVYDISGKLCLTQTMQNIQKETVELNVQGLSKGAYLLQVVTEEGVRTKRFVKD